MQGAQGVEDGGQVHQLLGQRPRHGRNEPERGHQHQGQAEGDAQPDAAEGHPDGPAADLHRIRHLGNVIGHQHDVGRFARGRGTARSHGDADVGRRQDRGVVNAVAHHDHRPRFHRRDRLHLVLGQQPGADIGDAQAFRHGGCGALAVAGEHDRAADAEPGQALQGGRRVFPHRVAHDQCAGKAPVHAHVDHHLARLQAGGLGVSGGLGHKAFLAHPDGVPVQHGLHAVGGHLLRIVCGAQGQSAGGCGPLHRGGQHVGGVLLGRGGQAQHVLRAEARLRADLHQSRLPVREGSGLVEGCGPGLGHLLEHGPALDDDAAARRTAHTAQEGDGSGDQQRAGGGQDQHLREADRIPAQCPGKSGDQQGDHGEGHGEAVCQPYHGCLGICGLGHQGDNALVLAVRRRRRSPQQHGAGAVHGSAHHGVPGVPGDGKGLAGQGGFIEVRAGGHQLAVHRDHLGRTDQEQVPGDNIGGGDVLGSPLGVSAAEPVGLLGCSLQQGIQLAAGASGGVILEGLAAGEHQDDNQRGQVLAHGNRGGYGNDGQDIQPPVARPDVPDHASRGLQRHRGGENRCRPGSGGTGAGPLQEKVGHCDQHSGKNQRIAAQRARYPVQRSLAHASVVSRPARRFQQAKAHLTSGGIPGGQRRASSIRRAVWISRSPMASSSFPEPK